MKITPYLRFLWATSLSFHYIRQTRHDIGESDNIEVSFVILSGLLTLSFVGYCIIMGLQEIRNQKIIDAKYFESFGIIFELMIFLGGLYLLSILLQKQNDPWRIGLMALWQIGLLTLLVVDIKKIRAS